MQSETQQRQLQRVMQSDQQVSVLWFCLQSIQGHSAHSFILISRTPWFWLVSSSAACFLTITAHSLWRLLERQPVVLLRKSEDSSGRSPELWKAQGSLSTASGL